METSLATPKISICIPTYNGEKFLAETIESARALGGDDVEIVISDDASTDGTPPLIEKYAAKDRRIRALFSKKNRGLVGNWNFCLLEARGEWIKFLFQDDVLYPQFYQRIAGHLDGECSFIICNRDIKFESGTPPELVDCYRSLMSMAQFIPQERRLTPIDFSWIVANFLAYNFVGEPSNCMFRRNCISEVGFFNTRIRQLVDLEFWARLGCRFGAVFIPQPLSFFRAHSSSTTASHFSFSKFSTEFLDQLKLVHDFCFAPHFQIVRDVYRRAAISLEERFGAFVNGLEKNISAAEQTEKQILDSEVLRPLALCCIEFPLVWDAVKRRLPHRAAQLARLFPEDLL